MSLLERRAVRDRRTSERRDRRADDHVDPTTPEVSRILFRTDPEWRTQDFRIAGVCPVDHTIVTMNMPITDELQKQRTATKHVAEKMLETFVQAWLDHARDRHR